MGIHPFIIHISLGGVLKITPFNFVGTGVFILFSSDNFYGTQGSTFTTTECTNKTLTIDPFIGATPAKFRQMKVSPEVEAGVVVGLQCLQP
jgi:hypothetical protein